MSRSRRHFPDWLKAYQDYTIASEAPAAFHFWVGVSTIAGALRRRVWIDQIYFRWVPNFYIILVAPPGIVNKSTTIDVGMRLLKQIDGVKFAPESTTWQSLIQHIAESRTIIEDPINGATPACCVTIPISELGTFLAMDEQKMVDHLVSLWDGKIGEFEKSTKTQGKDTIVNPWINIVAGTTPAWINGNFPQYMIGGGFTSRCIFVFANEKRQFVAYPKLAAAHDTSELRFKLVEDLQRISELVGEYELDKGAIEFGSAWYQDLFTNTPVHLRTDDMGGYLARKQTHVHKLAMVLAAAEGDEMVITERILRKAVALVDSVETNLQKVYSAMGASNEGVLASAIMRALKANGGMVLKSEIVAAMMLKASSRQIEDALKLCTASRQVSEVQNGSSIFLKLTTPSGAIAAPSGTPGQ